MADWVTDRPNADRLEILAGQWDPANGNLWPKSFNELLRWWALFFERIIVPDSYFCCYGPLYQHLHDYDLLNQDAGNPLLSLLSAGVIVPAIVDANQDANIYDTWASPATGSLPGRPDRQPQAAPVEDYASSLNRLPAPVPA